MQRSSIIIAGVTTAGLLAGGFLAGYSVIQASMSSGSEETSVIILKEASSAKLPSDTTVTSSAAGAGLTGLNELSGAAPTVSSSGESKTPASSGSKVPSTQGAVSRPSTIPSSHEPSPTKKPTAKASASVVPTLSPTATAEAALVTESQAGQIVSSSATGTVLSSTLSTSTGQPVWAVQVQRADSSIVTGFVDAYTGQIVNWIENSPPASATPAPSSTLDNESTESTSPHEESTESKEGDHDNDDD